MTRLVFLTLMLLAGFSACSQQKGEVYVSDGLAIKGYDPVAYFELGKAVVGKSDNQFSWKGATWQFPSAENKALFEESPEQYAPQYGGYCAYAVANGYTAKIDPKAFKIVAGKLYLN